MLNLFTWARLGRILEVNEGDDNFLAAESTIQATVLSIGANTPPSVAADSLPYIVGGSPTGAWAGHANELARYVTTIDGPEWRFYSIAYVLNLSDGRLWMFSGGTWQPAAREILTAARTYYVRTDGSDSNNGLSNTSGGAFLTIQRAVDVVASLDVSIYSVVISVGAGTFAGVLLKDPMGAGNVSITCAGTANTTIQNNGSGNTIRGQGATGKYTISAARILATGSGLHSVMMTTGQSVTLSSVDMGASAGMHFAAVGGLINLGAYTVSGAAQIHWYSTNRGLIVANANVTLTGTPAFSTSFAHCDNQSSILTGAITFTGSATGKRYTVAKLGLISVNGAGASYFPGNVAGTVDTATFGVYS